MFYLVKAYNSITGEFVKQREVLGFDQVNRLTNKWEQQGYEVNTLMQCMKYLAVKELSRPKSH